MFFTGRDLTAAWAQGPKAALTTSHSSLKFWDVFSELIRTVGVSVNDWALASHVLFTGKSSHELGC